jgi:transposase
MEFLDLLKLVEKARPRVKLHIVADNYATHKHPKVKAWLEHNPLITMHFTPTSGSWMNLVEIFFGIITGQATLLRHLHQRQRAHQRYRGLHRRLERSVRTLRVDQDRR